jgi:ParB family chromosome partitioning protein
MANAAAIPKTELMEVDIDLINVEEGFNPRTEFDPEKLDSLSETVEAFGVTQTLRLRPTSDGHYTIVAGERRYWAAKAAALEKVPAMVGELTDREAKSIAWIENRHRSNLNPIEDAQASRPSPRSGS